MASCAEDAMSQWRSVGGLEVELGSLAPWAGWERKNAQPRRAGKTKKSDERVVVDEARSCLAEGDDQSVVSLWQET